ncbi:hypothetical protein ACIP98_42425 [Streptomyces sp. NPDC088354]|uniref:hypothetical protein n=1 Tax=Streptomyces sp. NPDC088354 TaxID=3365856 RepID=UPI00381506E9
MGVQRQDTGTAGRIENSQVAVKTRGRPDAESHHPGFPAQEPAPAPRWRHPLIAACSRDLAAALTPVRAYQDSLDHWCALFIVAVQVQPLPATGVVIGIDGGVAETAITTSEAVGAVSHY